MASTSFTFPGTGANNADAGNVAWSNPGNIVSDNGVNSGGAIKSGQTSQYLHATNFGFAIPATAVIDGIIVRIQRQGPSSSTVDHTVQLIVGGSRTGTNKSAGATWVTSMADVDFGASNDTWGLTPGSTITATLINGSDFGFALRASATGTDAFAVDCISIQIHYTDVLDGVASSSGVATGSFTAAPLAATAVSVAGVSSNSFVGAYNSSQPFSSAGIGAVSWKGTGIIGGALSAAGIGAMNASAAVESTVGVVGVATVSFAGGPLFSGTYTAAGVATAAFIRQIDAVFSAAGVATVSPKLASGSDADFMSAGVATVSPQLASINDAALNAPGVATVTPELAVVSLAVLSVGLAAAEVFFVASVVGWDEDSGETDTWTGDSVASGSWTPEDSDAGSWV